MSIWPPPCSFKRTERTPCRLQLVLQGILKTSHCSTPLIHSTCLERQRTQAVDSLESPVTKGLVCRESFQIWGAQHNQNLTLVKQHLFEVVMENSVVFDIFYFILFLMVVLENYLKKQSSLKLKLFNTQEGSLTVKLTACSALYC